jgi:uncharacterized membrane protein YccC
MLIFGLLLVLLSAAAGVLALVYNGSGGPEQMVRMFGRDLFNVTPAQAFVAGLVLSLVFCLGIWMIVTTERRRRVARDQYRDARLEARDASKQARMAAKERDKLAAELAQRDENWTEPVTTRSASADPVTAPTPVQAPPAAPPVEEAPQQHRRFGRHFRKSERQPEVTTPPPSQ